MLSIVEEYTTDALNFFLAINDLILCRLVKFQTEFNIKPNFATPLWPMQTLQTTCNLVPSFGQSVPSSAFILLGNGLQVESGKENRRNGKQQKCPL